MIKFVNKIIPSKDEIEKFSTKYIDDIVLETPVIAWVKLQKKPS